MEHDLRNLNLFFFEQEIRNRLIIWELDQERLNESEDLVNHLFISEIDISSHDCLGDMFGHLSFSLEFEIFDETRVFVHGEDNVGHSLEGSGQELGNIGLAVLIDVSLVAGTIVGSIA